MKRLHRLQAGLAKREWDALLVNRPDDIRYLTGARGTLVRLLVSAKEALLLSHFVDLEQTRLEVHGLPVHRTSGIDGVHETVEHLKRLGVRKLALNLESMSQAQYKLLSERLKVDDIEISSDKCIVRKMRWRKDEQELARIRRATDINDAAYEHIIPLLKPGVTGREIAIETRRFMWEAGVETIRFLAVQFGPHSALPHCQPTDRTLQKGDFALLDWVPVYEGYASDVTRTVIVGEPTDRQREVYELVEHAQAVGLQAAVPGATGGEVDTASREIIEAGGYGEQFGHSLGHGINEGPSLDQGSEDVLEPGMVVTIEPGIYIPGWGGVRIEDTVVITKEGAEPLSKSSKELAVL
jgi:Xaa-Pro aminopeptidase